MLNDNPAAAIPYYQQLLDLSNQVSEYTLKAHYGLGYAYYNTERYGLAIPHFQYYLSQASNLPDKQYYEDAMIRLADCYLAQRNYSEATNLYGQAIQRNFADKDYAYYRLGQAQSLSNNLAAARSSFDVLINQFPNSIYYDQALYQKGLLDLEAGSYAVAISTFSRLIKEKVGSSLVPEALLRRALASRNIGNNAAAIEDYKRLVNDFTTHPNAASALLSLQELLSSEGRENELPPLLAKYREANPNSQTAERVYFENAKSAYLNQQYQEAVTALKQYVRDYPQSPFVYDARFFLAESYYRLDQFQDALLQHRLVVQEQKSTYLSRSIRRAADLALDRKAYSEAANYYRQLASVTESKREQVLAWVGLVKSYYEIQKYDSLNFFAERIINQADVAGAKNEARLYQEKWPTGSNNFRRLSRFFSR
ncbi:MAG: tetratricopeptide repeat protein [Bacteroidia bacterium]|nr:tetratricopeptide repeat protein [Bacteroidia bacterium]